MPKPTRKKEKPEDLIKKWERLSSEHAEAGKLLREIVVAKLAQIKDSIDSGEECTEIRYLRGYGETLARAVDLERQALHMDLQRDNTAIQRVQQLGFLVQRPDGAIDVDATVIE